MTDLMRAAAVDQFGDPYELKIVQRPRPKLAPDGVLIRVVGAGVNPVDWKICAGRLQAAFPHSFPLTPGFDAAGVIEAVGAAVHRFKVGDAVFGYFRKHFIGEGAYAEYLSAPEDLAEASPHSIDLLQAAAVPTGALSAYQSVHGALAVTSGDAVVVGGAAGGAGGFAVQLAAAAGARVIGLASPKNHDYVRTLGADEVVDYNDPQLTRTLRSLAGNHGIAAVLDVMGGEDLMTLLGAVREGGRVASLVDQSVRQKAAEHGATGTYVFGRHVPGQLAEIASLIDAGQLSVYTETVPLADAADVHRRSMTGHALGKLVLSIDG